MRKILFLLLFSTLIIATSMRSAKKSDVQPDIQPSSVTKVVNPIVTFKPYGPICDYNTPFQLCANPIDGALSRQWVAHTDQGDIILEENLGWCVEVPVNTRSVDLFVTLSNGVIKGKQRIGITNCGN
ncbi:hypothetical protein H7F33_07045 [Pedobacter sp. PAMC26386]|nr:hypothetical protein H7F33_07045 [Pedobacter sp. PAMC26386]